MALPVASLILAFWASVNWTLTSFGISFSLPHQAVSQDRDQLKMRLAAGGKCLACKYLTET
jgi:hypothetical protein